MSGVDIFKLSSLPRKNVTQCVTACRFSLRAHLILARQTCTERAPFPKRSIGVLTQIESHLYNPPLTSTRPAFLLSWLGSVSACVGEFAMNFCHWIWGLRRPHVTKTVSYQKLKACGWNSILSRLELKEDFPTAPSRKQRPAASPTSSF